MLEAFAARRAKAQQEEALRAQQEDHFRQQMAERQVDNARAERFHTDEIGLQRQQFAANEAQRKAVTGEAQRREGAAAFPQIRDAVRTDPALARSLAEAHGGQLLEKPAPEVPAWAMPRGMGLAMGFGQDVPTVPQPPPGPPSYQFALPGRTLDIPSAQDQEATRTAAREQQAKQFEAQIGPTAASPFALKALRETGAMMRAPTWDAKEDPFKSYQARMQALEGQDVTLRGQRAAAARVGAGLGLRERGADRQDKSLEDRELRDWKDTVGWKTLTTGGRTLQAAVANISGSEPKDILKHRDAMIQLARYFRGGVPSEGEMATLYHNLGGRLGNGMQAFMERMTTGDLTPLEMEMVQTSVKTAHEEWKQNIDEAQTSAQEMFGDSPRAMGKIKGMFKALGVEYGKPHSERGQAPALAPDEDARMKAAGF